MNIQQFSLGKSLPTEFLNLADTSAQWVLCFGMPEIYRQHQSSLRTLFPAARITGCSTAGQIQGCEVFEETLNITVIRFESTRVKAVSESLNDHQGDSEACGRALAKKLDQEGLKHVFLLSVGLNLNGSALMQGFESLLPEQVGVTGGMAGDGERFCQTWVWLDDNLSDRLVLAVGLYGDAVRVGCGLMGGWSTFGPERVITRSRHNELLELDGQPALSLYKRYLGQYAEGLPATALLFPLSIRDTTESQGLVRTVLATDDDTGSMTFAGDMPEGCHAQMMSASPEKLIIGAAEAAAQARESLAGPASLAILVSCVGRRMVLKQGTEDELESVHAVLGAGTALCGFYSYGEFAPLSGATACDLHNQTMTVTTFHED
jgi:hypothetical protein